MNGFWERVAIAFRCFFSILFHGDIPNDIAQKMSSLPVRFHRRQQLLYLPFLV